MKRFTDEVAALEFIKQVGDSQLVIRVADFARTGHLVFAAFLGRDLKPMLIAIFLRRLEHILMHITLGVFGRNAQSSHRVPSALALRERGKARSAGRCERIRVNGSRRDLLSGIGSKRIACQLIPPEPPVAKPS